MNKVTLCKKENNNVNAASRSHFTLRQLLASCYRRFKRTHTKDADTGFENILMEWYTLWRNITFCQKESVS